MRSSIVRMILILLHFPDMDDATTTQVERRLAARGARLTAARRAVLEELTGNQGPTTATDLGGALPSIPLSSLYRSLSVLSDAGILETVPGNDGILLYEPAEWLAGHHHHLVCRECGTVIDMDVTNALEAALEGVAAQAVAGHGFQSDGHRLTLEGRCAVCADA
ncbi:MAG: transcriptional repressor [Acidimicrobiia bacterium]|nr:MAG: transcriptional repressor [Acidimicrobiia bacterium]